jgi:hypothetical protein
MEYIQSSLWEHVEKSNTKIAKRVYNELNKDILQVVKDGKVFWIEKVCSYITIPNFVYNYVIKFYKKQGLKYLYE